MRKVFTAFILVLVVANITLSSVQGQSMVVPTPSDDKAQELTVDTACITSKFLSFTPTPGASSDDFSNCSRVCPRWCLYNQDPNNNNEWTLRKNGYCTQDELTEVYSCHALSESQNISDALQKINFMGIEIDRAPLILVRRVMLGALGAAGLVIIAIGLYALYKLSFSEGQQEKVQEAVKMFKSLIIGSVITFSGVVLVQVVAAAIGITGSLVDFNFLPRTGRVVYLYKDDLGKACLIEQVAMNGGETYICDPTTLVWTAFSVTPTP